jgi:hypothetical protein
MGITVAYVDLDVWDCCVYVTLFLMPQGLFVGMKIAPVFYFSYMPLSKEQCPKFGRSAV